MTDVTFIQLHFKFFVKDLDLSWLSWLLWLMCKCVMWMQTLKKTKIYVGLLTVYCGAADVAITRRAHRKLKNSLLYLIQVHRWYFFVMINSVTPLLSHDPPCVIKAHLLPQACLGSDGVCMCVREGLFHQDQTGNSQPWLWVLRPYLISAARFFALTIRNNLRISSATLSHIQLVHSSSCKAL